MIDVLNLIDGELCPARNGGWIEGHDSGPGPYPSSAAPVTHRIARPTPVAGSPPPSTSTGTP